MNQSPYKDARRVFWVMDNGSSHRGAVSIRRLTQAHPRLIPVHGPVHASWLNQIEIHFSIVQRKALRPNDFTCLEALAERLASFERYYESIAHPFEWKFTRVDLNALIARMRSRHAQTQQLKLVSELMKWTTKPRQIIEPAAFAGRLLGRGEVLTEVGQDNRHQQFPANCR